jgi:hypothetical protein
MTMLGIAVGTAIGIALLLWVVVLIRQDRLYAGYGVIFIVGTIAAIAVLIVPPWLRAATAASVALMPEPSLSLVAIVLLTFLVVYVFIQISVLANRVMRLTQELAIRTAQREQPADRPSEER